MPTLRHPSALNRPPQVLQHSTTAADFKGLGAGGAVTAGQTYREVIAVSGALRVVVALLPGASAGTLNIKPVSSLVALEGLGSGLGSINPASVKLYSSAGVVGTGAVSANTEASIKYDNYGWDYLCIEYVCTTSGTLGSVEVAQLLSCS